MALNEGDSVAEIDPQIEASLQKAIKLNPSFAPAYDELAFFYAKRHKNLDQAHMLNLQAVQLDPGNIGFRINTAQVLLVMQRETDATTVLQHALKVAKTPQEVMAVQNELQAVQQMQSARRQNEEEARRFRETMTVSQESETEAPEPGIQQKEEVVSGPHQTVTGTIKNVQCSAPAIMELEVDAGSKTIALHTSNYYKVKFSALNYTPRAELHPCSDLEGMHAKVEYIESATSKINGLVAVELHK